MPRTSSPSPSKRRRISVADSEEEDSNVSACLPFDIIIDVLTRLPPRKILQFTTVCKLWSNLITTSYFARAHARRASRKAGYIFQVRSMNVGRNPIWSPEERPFDAFFLNAEETSVMERKLLVSDSKPIFCIHDSCNGLLLLEKRTGGEIDCFGQQNCSHNMVYDPTAHSFKPLPPVKSHKSTVWTLACDSTGQKYIVVRACYCYKKNTCEVITLESGWGSWREIDLPQPLRILMARPVFASGYLHWMIGSRMHILTMDVGSEVFYKTACPECATKIYNLLEVNGGLCFVDHLSNTRLRLWDLKDLEGKEWLVRCDIDLGHLKELPFEGFLEGTRLRDFYNEPKCQMVFENRLGRLFRYDMDMQRIERIGCDVEKWPSPAFPTPLISPIRHVPSLEYL